MKRSEGGFGKVVLMSCCFEAVGLGFDVALRGLEVFLLIPDVD